MKSLIILVIVLFATNAFGVCRSSYVCDDGGYNCRYVDICDNTYDLPSINVPPIPALPSVELKPLPSINVPPIGTSRCQYMQVNGRWQNVCR
jgi:hypothetical protein